MRWIKYYKNLLNPARAKLIDTCDTTDFGKKGVEEAGKDEIRPEMLKVMNGEGVRWLTRVCSVARKLKKHQKTGRQM